jgi:type VI secretion system protein ImpC
MSTLSSDARLEFGLEFGRAPSSHPRNPDAPLRVLILADFSGRSARNACEPLAGRTVRRVDIDNLEQVFAGFHAALTLSEATVPNGALDVAFASLDDFHPDQLMQQIGPLSELLSARALLKSPHTAAQGAQALERLLGAMLPPAADAAAEPVTKADDAESTDDTLNRLMGHPSTSTAPPAPKSGGVTIDALIKDIVGTTDAAAPEPAGQAALLAAVDMELATQLRSVMHNSGFQALEAAWRALDLLVRRCPDEERVTFQVLDVALDELDADLAELYRLLRDEPPDLLVGNYAFGAGVEDLRVLGGLAQLCAALNASFLGAADPSLVGCDSFDTHPDPDEWKLAVPVETRATWQSLRALPDAAHVGLALPRFLLRLPYGVASDPIDSFGFEEIPDPAAHDALLWGNSEFLCAHLLADAFAAEGDAMQTAGAGDVDDIPVFTFMRDGEKAAKPCAEAWLVDRAADEIRQHGLIPCQSIKGRDAVHVPGIQSIAEGAPPLAGRWTAD